MLERAKARLAGVQDVELRAGELESLPVADSELDAAVISLVLHHSPDPRRVIAETMRVLKPGGRLLLIDLLPHDRAEYREQLGHVWLGFSQEQVTEWLNEAGFSRVNVVALPADPGAKAPAVFAASGTR
jgi:ArsR family transcriptional regulator